MHTPDRAPSDWSAGAPKWAAVAVLAAASALTALFASTRQPNPLAPRAVSRTPADPSPGPGSSDAGVRTDASTPSRAEPLEPAGDTPDPAQAPSETTSAATLQAKIDINSATSEQLQVLPGIGPTLAARIVEHRLAHGPFRSLSELDRVPGIGPATLEKLRPHLEFR